MSKGQKKPSLQSLSRELLQPEDNILLSQELITSTDRSAAIVASSIVEASLRNAIAARFRNLTEDQFERMFFHETAPLGSFSSLTRVGYAIGVCDAQMVKLLDSIRRIRNVFAHCMRPISFSHELIRVEVGKLPNAPLSQEKMNALGLDLTNLSPEKERYIGVALRLSIVMGDDAQKFIKQVADVQRQKAIVTAIKNAAEKRHSSPHRPK